MSTVLQYVCFPILTFHFRNLKVCLSSVSSVLIPLRSVMVLFVHELYWTDLSVLTFDPRATRNISNVFKNTF